MGAKTGRILWIILTGALLVWCFLRFRTVSREADAMQKPAVVTELGSDSLRAGEIVSVEYDSIYSGNYYGGVPYGKVLNYQALKLSGREEYLYVSAYMEDDSFYKGKPYYFRSAAEAQEFQPEQKYTFLGRVYELSQSEKEGILAVLDKENSADRVPMTTENTDTAVAVRLLDPERVQSSKTNWMYFTLVAALLWLFMVYRWYEEIRAVAYMRSREQSEREEARNLERKVKFTSQVEEDDFKKE